MQDFQRTKSTSFHSVALNVIYVLVLIVCHFVFPYIHELVFSFFNGLFLILSVALFFYINLLLRTSSVTHFTYLSLFLRIFVSIFIFSFSIIFISFLTNTIEIIQRAEFLIFLIFLFSFCILAMLITKLVYKLIKPETKLQGIFVTDHDDAKKTNVLNFLKTRNLNIKSFHANDIDTIIKYSGENQVEAVYISIDSKNLNNLEDIITSLSLYAFKIHWILPMSFFGDDSNNMTPKIVMLNESPVLLDSNQYLLKRSVDVFGSIILLSLFLPFIILVSILIKLTDNGPIFYFQKRYGQNGIIFDMIKFRSMKVNSHDPNLQVKNDDDRVTNIGRLIRKTSFDEIPQLINILRGQMSLVGPRPQTVDEIATYSKMLSKFLTRHHVKPGLTGLAQIRSRVKTDSLFLMNEKLESDLEYIQKWSLYLDLKILINTPISMWKNKKSNT